MENQNESDLDLAGDNSPHFKIPQPGDNGPAWEEVDPGRYMPRRVRGSCVGRALG
ncbi:hypothetical protein [Lignipirellula cremea]|uniref:Uncharacterized protein n=1 Tax=Lignipirellula cremea TaxID=2528010 RepID=A0A518DTN8_9BACT|nr:hypothetical protein [Lignipirellula cremea]QDU95197.1 hypothetical protein Pla8534_30110 [Lignipirellula cremea]